MRALVTGASGFVGAHLIDHLLDRGDEVIAAVAPGTKPKQNVPIFEGNITDYTRTIDIVSQANPDVIYHLAGIAFAPAAENDFLSALSVNVGGTFNVMRGAHLLDKNISVVHISSGEVYGRVSHEHIPVREELPPKPANSYSLTKLMSEQVALRYESGSKVRIITARPFNHTGPGQSDVFVCSSFAKQLALIKLGKAEPIMKVGNLSPQRDFSDVRDIVKAYRLAAEKGTGTYNLGSGKPVAVEVVLHTLREIAGIDVRIELDPSRMRPAEVPVLYADISKANKELGWVPRYSLRDTLHDTYQYWLSALG
jgi:GDP-4-dehydro-6-deoxy-D-mannose reductase